VEKKESYRFQRHLIIEVNAIEKSVRSFHRSTVRNDSDNWVVYFESERSVWWYRDGTERTSIYVGVKALVSCRFENFHWFFQDTARSRVNGEEVAHSSLRQGRFLHERHVRQTLRLSLRRNFVNISFNPRTWTEVPICLGWLGLNVNSLLRTFDKQLRILPPIALWIFKRRPKSSARKRESSSRTWLIRRSTLPYSRIRINSFVFGSTSSNLAGRVGAEILGNKTVPVSVSVLVRRKSRARDGRFGGCRALAR